jgi:nicotinamidase-related amidase
MSHILHLSIDVQTAYTDRLLYLDQHQPTAWKTIHLEGLPEQQEAFFAGITTTLDILTAHHVPTLHIGFVPPSESAAYQPTLSISSFAAVQQEITACATHNEWFRQDTFNFSLKRPAAEPATIKTAFSAAENPHIVDYVKAMQPDLLCLSGLWESVEGKADSGACVTATAAAFAALGLEVCIVAEGTNAHDRPLCARRTLHKPLGIQITPIQHLLQRLG